MTGAEIKLTRLTLRLTAKELAKILEVSENTIARYETGKIKMPQEKMEVFLKFKNRMTKDRLY